MIEGKNTTTDIYVLNTASLLRLFYQDIGFLSERKKGVLETLHSDLKLKRNSKSATPHDLGKYLRGEGGGVKKSICSSKRLHFSTIRKLSQHEDLGTQNQTDSYFYFGLRLLL